MDISVNSIVLTKARKQSKPLSLSVDVANVHAVRLVRTDIMYMDLTSNNFLVIRSGGFLGVI